MPAPVLTVEDEPGTPFFSIAAQCSGCRVTISRRRFDARVDDIEPHVKALATTDAEAWLAHTCR
jgi:hypothetical protein